MKYEESIDAFNNVIAVSGEEKASAAFGELRKLAVEVPYAFQYNDVRETVLHISSMPGAADGFSLLRQLFIEFGESMQYPRYRSLYFELAGVASEYPEVHGTLFNFVREIKPYLKSPIVQDIIFTVPERIANHKLFTSEQKAYHIESVYSKLWELAEKTN